MRRLQHRMIWALLLGGLLLSLSQAWSLYGLYGENQLIAEWAAWANRQSPNSSAKNADDSPAYHATPQLLLARAAYLHQKQRYNEALAILSLLVSQGDSRLQTQSRYNLGNVYLSQALAEVEAEHINQAVPLLTLAKQAYRQALTQDSGLWDAKYNLELAMRLLPEFDRISQTADDNDAVQPSQLWTTLPGFPRGLP